MAPTLDIRSAYAGSECFMPCTTRTPAAVTRSLAAPQGSPTENRCCPLVGGGKAYGDLLFSSRIADDQIRAAQTDAIDLSTESPPRRFTCLIY
jgi:hypothetical protein